jgi:hypothetical protein
VFICWCDHTVQVQVLEEVLLGFAQGYPSTTAADTLGNHNIALLSKLLRSKQEVCAYGKHTGTRAPQGLCSCLTVMPSQLTHGTHVAHVGRVCVRTDCHAMRAIVLCARTTCVTMMQEVCGEGTAASPNSSWSRAKVPPSARDTFLQVASLPKAVLTSILCYVVCECASQSGLQCQGWQLLTRA